jgi:hypothetical protein
LIGKEPSILEDVGLAVLILYKEDMGATAKEDKRRVDVFDNFELLSFDSDLGNIPREVYHHQGVNAEDLWASIGECKYNVCEVNSLIPSDGGPGSQTYTSSINQYK